MCLFRETALQRAAFCRRRCPHAFIPSFKSAAQLLVGCRIEKDFSHLALPPSGGDAFARPCHRLVHVSAFQYPKTADVFLGLKVRPVGDENCAIGLRSQRLRGPKSASEFPDAGGNHLFVERVDLAAYRFVHLGRVEVVGEVTSNQILRHCLLLEWSSGWLVALPSRYSRSGDRKSTAIPIFISAAESAPGWPVPGLLRGCPRSS